MFEFNATLLVAMFSFVVFIMIMNAIFYRPILNIIRQREDYIKSNYDRAEELEKLSQEYKQTHTQKINETHDLCRKNFNSAVGTLQKKADEKITQAKLSSKQELEKQKQDLSVEEANLKKSIQSSVINDLAQTITDKFTSGVIE